MIKKTRSTKSEKWRHILISVKIAWTNEQKADLKWLLRHMVVTEIATRKKTKRRPIIAPAIAVRLLKRRDRATFQKVFKSGVHFQLYSKNILYSASKLKAIKRNTCHLAIALRDFDNLMHYDLMTALYHVSFDFALLTLAVFTMLRNSMYEKT